MTFKRPFSMPPSLQRNNDKLCGDEARLINYGVLSCQSCTALFRRNGSLSEVCIVSHIIILHFYEISLFFLQIVHPCQYDGECKVNILTRKVCTACRLDECFSVGISTDFILKEVYPVKKNSSSIKSNTTQVDSFKPIIVCMA